MVGDYFPIFNSIAQHVLKAAFIFTYNDMHHTAGPPCSAIMTLMLIIVPDDFAYVNREA